MGNKAPPLNTQAKAGYFMTFTEGGVQIPNGNGDEDEIAKAAITAHDHIIDYVKSNNPDVEKAVSHGKKETYEGISGAKGVNVLAFQFAHKDRNHFYNWLTQLYPFLKTRCWILKGKTAGICKDVETVFKGMLQTNGERYLDPPSPNPEEFTQVEYDPIMGRLEPFHQGPDLQNDQGYQALLKRWKEETDQKQNAMEDYDNSYGKQMSLHPLQVRSSQPISYSSNEPLFDHYDYPQSYLYGGDVEYVLPIMIGFGGMVILCCCVIIGLSGIGYYFLSRRKSGHGVIVEPKREKAHHYEV